MPSTSGGKEKRLEPVARVSVDWSIRRPYRSSVIWTLALREAADWLRRARVDRPPTIDDV